MSFAVAAESYDRFMGRYSEPLAPLLADFGAVTSGQHVLDVGCGPGALTAELVKRVGTSAVSAVDPSEPFVAACRERFPDVDLRLASAEELPFATDSFDAALAQLVVHFMADPVAGLREMARVTRPDGFVAATVWDHAEGGQGALSLFWEAALEIDPKARGEGALAGAASGHLAELFRAAGLHDVEDDALWVHVEHATFDDWWLPYTLGVGPVGAFVAGLAPDLVDRLRERCRERLPDPPFTLSARAWAARGHAG